MEPSALSEINEHAPFFAKVLKQLSADATGPDYFEFLEELVISQQNIEAKTGLSNVPDFYFENLETAMIGSMASESSVKKISLPNKRIWLSVAAIFIIVFMSSIMVKIMNGSDGNPIDSNEGTKLTAFVDNLNENDVDLLVNDLTTNEEVALLIKSGLLQENHLDEIGMTIFENDNATSLEEYLDWEGEALMN